MGRNFKKRWKILNNLWIPFTKSGIDRHSAAACFYILLSVLPAAALGLTVFSIISVTKSHWNTLLADLFPASFLPVLEYIFSSISPRQPVALLSIWAILTLWSASKGVMAITAGLSDILNGEARHGFIRRRLYAMAVLLLLLFVLSAMLLLHVFGRWILIQLSLLFPARSSLMYLFFRLRHLYSLIVLTALFTLFYSLLPGKPLHFSACIKSGLLSSFGWLLTSSLFSIYVNHFQSYQRLYGSLGLLVLGCLWLKISLSVLLYSVQIIKLWHDGTYHPILILKSALLG